MIHYSKFDIEGYKPKFATSKKKGTFCNDTITLDTEISNYYILPNGDAIAFDFTKPPEWYKSTKPQSVLYIWMMGINKDVVYGRTNAELKDFLKLLHGKMNGATSIIYVHNLSYDFNFLKNVIGVDCEVFSRKTNKTIKINYVTQKLEFRCSLFLTNKSLAKAAEEVNAPVGKLAGDLDYNVLRTPLTVLTDKEMLYCEHDILCLYYVIEDKLKKYTKGVYDIPMTQTGQVRRELKKRLYNERKYKKQVKDCWPDYDQFELLRNCFYGGYTHANARHTNKALKNVFSYDITSSYPYILCTQKFPVKTFMESYQKDFNMLNRDEYAFIADVTLYGVECKGDNTFLSISKGKNRDVDGTVITYKDAKVDNGRIQSVSKARFILTDCDIDIINKAYKFDKCVINNVWTAPKNYLPKTLIQFILKLFSDKTKYKDVKEFESQYKEAKEFINSVYGMFVTKIICDNITFEDGAWKKDFLTKDMAAAKLTEMESQDNICSYSTGVWTTAFARKHLWDLIIKIGNDVVYCDTDSVKFLGEYNKGYFVTDMINVDIDIMKVCLIRGLEPEWFKVEKPNDDVSVSGSTAVINLKNESGNGWYKVDRPESKLAKLGYFEEESPYAQFKTLGAKKYAYIEMDDKDKTVHITIAGVNKKAGAKYFKNLNMFKPCTLLNYEFAGKKMVKYNTDQMSHTFPDGYVATEKYGCVLTPTTYLLNVTKDYSDILEWYIEEGYSEYVEDDDIESEDCQFSLGDGCRLFD